LKYKIPLGTVLSSVTLIALLVLAIAQPGIAQTKDLLISVAFKTDNPQGNSPLISGPEAAATFANPLFGAANLWNNLHFAYALNTNPSFNNLVDSTGTATGVKFAITGTVGATDFWPWESVFDPLRSGIVVWNSWTTGLGAFGAGESTSISWKLTGLPSNATFDMCLYGSFTDIDRGFDMTIQGIKMSIPTFGTAFNSPSAPPPRPNCVLFANVVSDARGTIHGVGAGVPGGETLDALNEANWSGFQLVQITRPRQNRGVRTGFQMVNR
jgi:hypothetical protein